MIDLNALGETVREWHDATFPGKTVGDVALKMAEEAGEVAGAQVRYDEISAGLRDGELFDARLHLAVELGDLAIVWLTLCERHGLSPEGVLQQRWAEVQNRRWKEQA